MSVCSLVEDPAQFLDDLAQVIGVFLHYLPRLIGAGRLGLVSGALFIRLIQDHGLPSLPREPLGTI